MTTMKRYHKLQEFPAHSTSVNCLKIGRKSSGVLVTGGEDKKVNVWAIGKSSAILTLQGHQSPIDCVAFDVSEEVVVAGATNGTIKMWDLDQAKVTRTLTGHRSNCLCVDFHPYGACLASGSLDTNIKIWDTRRRLCLSTLKGHTKGVTHIKFSPDGKWIVSGSENGEVKLWNIEAGKLFHDFKKHDNAVTGLDFHPREYILASCSADKTVRLWDIDTLETIDILGGECHGVRTAMFHPDGQHLLSALQDGLRVWSWEPAIQCDNVAVEWSRIADISIVSSHTRLVGCSYNQNMVGVWYIDLNVVNPWCQSQDGNIPLNGAYPTPPLITEAAPPVQPVLQAPPSQIPGVMNPLTQALSPVRQLANRGPSLLVSPAEAGLQGQHHASAQPTSARNAIDRHGRISDSGITSQADAQRKPTSLNYSRTSEGNTLVRDAPSPAPPTRTEPLSSRENLQPLSSRLASEPLPSTAIKRRSASNHVEYTSSTDTPEPKAPLSHRASRTPAAAATQRPAATARAAAASDDDPPPVENLHRRVSASAATTASSRAMQRTTSATQRARASSFPQVEIHVPAGPAPTELLQQHAPPPQPAPRLQQPFTGPSPPPYHTDDAYDTPAPLPSSRGRVTPRNVSPPMREMKAMQVSDPPMVAAPPSNGIVGGGYLAKPSPVIPSTSPPRMMPASTTPAPVPVPVPVPAAILAPAPAPAPVAAPAPTPSYAPNMSPEEQTLHMFRSGKDTLLPQWQVRASNMALIKTFLMRNNINGALSALKRHADVYLMAVILEVLTDNKAAITLDSIVDYVPLLETLLGSSHEHHHKVGMGMLGTILQHFGQYIRDTIAHGSRMRVDLTGEQRREKCMGIRTKLSTLVPKLAALPRTDLDIIQQAENLMMQLEQL